MARALKYLILVLLLGGLSLLVVLPFLTFLRFADDIKNKEKMMNRKLSGLTLQDKNGETFFTFSETIPTKYVPIKEIPLAVQQAVIAIEDKEFYYNRGFSLRGMMRALWVNMTTLSVREGGSTITQELVKNSLLTPNRSLLRKYQEIVLAFAVNTRYSKDEIMEMYLNSVYYGEGAYGIGTAAWVYFGKEAKDLDVAQSALLISLLPAPSSLSPLSNDPSRVKVRQKIVLKEMVDEGYISSEVSDKAYEEELGYKVAKEGGNYLAPHFALFVRDQLIQQYGEETALNSGYIVRTTLNRDWQQMAEEAVLKQIEKLTKNKATNGAVVVLDPKSGHILAMVGSVDWNNPSFGKMNMAITPREVGSAFKPVIYASAFERLLITPATLLHDEITVFSGNYKPHNFDNKTRGLVTVRRALANSLNIPAVEVMEKVGIREGIAMANRFGIELNDPRGYGLSMVLGSGEVSLLNLTSAYSVFANNGMRNKPVSILEIKDQYQQPIDLYDPKPERVISESVAYLISSILSDAKTRTEEFGNELTISKTAAVKTGTSEDFRNALTVGYTPNLVIGVWVGNNDNRPMDKIAGSLGAAPVWKSLMEAYLKDKTDDAFVKPKLVTEKDICPYAEVTQGTDTTSYKEYFLAGTEPQSLCPSAPNAEMQQPPSDIPANPLWFATPNSQPIPDPTVMPSPAPHVFIL